MKFASLCLLSYRRPEQLKQCLDSLIATADYPYQLIVNCDGYEEVNIIYLANMLRKGLISNLLISNGKNRGVGKSFQSCLGVAEGDYIFKIDTDLTFEPNWLSQAVKALETADNLGAISLFDYHNYDPNDVRFQPTANHLAVKDDYILVNDFVSSIYGFQKAALNACQFNGEDDGYHQTLRKFGPLAITKQDYVKNTGFGVTKSTYVSGTEDHPFKTPTYNLPLIFKLT